jgi:hypothetical protein
MARTGSKNGHSNGERANKRAKLDEDVDMNGNGQDEANGSKESDDLVSRPTEAGLMSSWTKRLVIYVITCVIDSVSID